MRRDVGQGKGMRDIYSNIHDDPPNWAYMAPSYVSVCLNKNRSIAIEQKIVSMIFEFVYITNKYKLTHNELTV